MKKITAILLAIIILFPFQSYAATMKSDNVEIHYFEYFPGLDRYVLDYTIKDYANATVTIFITPDDVTYTKEWGRLSINKKIYHNCNGTFNYHFELNGEIVGYIYNLETTLIEDELCKQEIPGDDENDIKTRITDNTSNGKKRINYDENGSVNYSLQKSNDNGTTWQDINNNTDSGTGSGYFEVTNPGYYRIIGTDENDNIISKDYISESEFETSKCDGCKTLNEMLACPAWDTYMSEFSEMISGAIPAPPSIEEGMDYLIEKLAEQTVEPEEPTAPEPFEPGYEEIETDLPTVIETEIEPAPTDYEPETGGPGSGPVIITDPEEWTPDDTDLGYTPPAPDPDTAPTYNEPGGDTETPPTYNPPGGGGGTPPTYTPPGGTPDTPPTYTPPGGTPGTTPGYNFPGSSGGGVPDYDYN